MYINVLVETKVKSNDMTFTYHVPSIYENLSLIGKRVLVPFGPRIIEGFVLNKTSKPDNYDAKDIIDVIDEDEVLNDELLDLGKFMNEKYLCNLISCYQAMLPKALKAKVKNKESIKTIKYIKLNNNISNFSIKGKKQLEIIDYLKDNEEVLKSTIESKSALKSLIDNNIVIEYEKEVYREVKIDENSKNITLTLEQENAVNKIKESFNISKTILLHGVTGSGKTEVYISLVKEIIKQNKTAIILVPEISLTPQITARFKGVFGENIAILHSSLSDGEKYDEFRRIKRGEVSVVIGARSAIFAPLNNIGILIIDEEHSDSYKQDCNPRYNTYDIAQKRSETHKCPVLLASATPTIESYARSMKGYYEFISLPNRVNKRPLPKVSIIDMKSEIRKGNKLISEELYNKIQDRLDKQEQVMLLLNRRGYSNYVSCMSCGYISKCPNCDITLTYHKTSNMLRCHYCGYGTKNISICPSCKEDSIRQIGTGTQKIEEEVQNMFQNAKVCRMDADTTSKKGSHHKIINEFNEGKYNILIGTQMISKGLNFPNVTLVGVINADSSLNIPNFRSSENTYSLLDQVIGRAGRDKKEGEAVIQTFNPDHYSIVNASNHDYKSFYNYEMNIRKKLNYPPYCFITLIKISSKDFSLGMSESNKIKDYLVKNLKSTNILGPSMANVLKVNNIYNFQIILKYKKDESLYGTLEELLKIYETNNKVKIEFDFSPIKL